MQSNTSSVALIYCPCCRERRKRQQKHHVLSNPRGVSSYTVSHTSSIYFLSWETLIIVPPYALRTLRITGLDKGEKFRVGSSRISTSAPDRLNFSKNTFAFCPPDSSAVGWLISSAVYFMEPRYVRIRVSSSFSPVVHKYSTGVRDISISSS